MSDLSRLRAWAEGMLEMEAKATPGPWAIDTEDVFSVPSGYAVLSVDATNDGPFVIAARNAFRPLAEHILSQYEILDDFDCGCEPKRVCNAKFCIVVGRIKDRLLTLAAAVLPHSGVKDGEDSSLVKISGSGAGTDPGTKTGTTKATRRALNAV